MASAASHQRRAAHQPPHSFELEIKFDEPHKAIAAANVATRRMPLPAGRLPWLSCSWRCISALCLAALVCWSACGLIFVFNFVKIPSLPSYFQPAWGGEPLPARGGGAGAGGAFESYLTVCTLVKDEERYLREWVLFHRLVGVTRFDVYDDGSTDGTAELLRRLGAGDGDVHRIPWPPAAGEDAEAGTTFHSQAEADEFRRRVAWCRRRDLKEHIQGACQLAAFSHCIARHRNRSRWVAVFDVDEFVFPAPAPPGRPLRTFRDALEPRGGEAPDGMAIEGLVFGASGRQEPPPLGTLTLEAYQRRAPATYGREGLLGRFLDPPAKSIADPRAVARAEVHRHAYLPAARSYRVAAEGGPIRYFHFQYKSVAEARAKAAANGNPHVLLTAEKDAALSAVPDATAAVFLPLLRARLAQPLPPDPGPPPPEAKG
eukprot:tig00000405_g493.t1